MSSATEHLGEILMHEVTQVIPITDAMREPHKFPKALTGVMLGTLGMCHPALVPRSSFLATVLFGGAGALAYLTFGSDVKSVVLVNLDQTSKFTQSVRFVQFWKGCSAR
jgi:proton-coupled amino acid transporter